MTRFYRIAADDARAPAQRVEHWLRDCEAVLAVQLTVHDHVGFFRDSDGQPLLMGRNIHPHRYCQLERSSTVRRCMQHCVDAVHPAAAQRRQPFATCCWKGMREIVVPMLHDEVHVATLFAGGWRRARQRLELPDMPRRSAVAAAQQQLPTWNGGHGDTLAHHLQMWSEGLVSLVLRLRAHDDSNDRRHRIQRFIDRHLAEHLRLEDLAGEFGLSTSRASHLVQELCGRSFQQLLLQERVTRARVLLQASPHSLAAIAERCGFTDVYYFSRVFRRAIGLPPGAYRKRYGHTAP